MTNDTYSLYEVIFGEGIQGSDNVRVVAHSLREALDAGVQFQQLRKAQAQVATNLTPIGVRRINAIDVVASKDEP